MVGANASETMLLKAYINARVMWENSEVYKAKPDEKKLELL